MMSKSLFISILLIVNLTAYSQFFTAYERIAYNNDFGYYKLKKDITDAYNINPEDNSDYKLYYFPDAWIDIYKDSTNDVFYRAYSSAKRLGILGFYNWDLSYGHATFNYKTKQVFTYKDVFLYQSNDTITEERIDYIYNDTASFIDLDFIAFNKNRIYTNYEQQLLGSKFDSIAFDENNRITYALNSFDVKLGFFTKINRTIELFDNYSIYRNQIVDEQEKKYDIDSLKKEESEFQDLAFFVLCNQILDINFIKQNPGYKYYKQQKQELINKMDSIVFGNDDRIIYLKDSVQKYNWSKSIEVLIKNKKLIVKTKVIEDYLVYHLYDSLGRLITLINPLHIEDSIVDTKYNYTYNGTEIQSAESYKINYEDYTNDSIVKCQLMFRREFSDLPDGGKLITDYYKEYDKRFYHDQIEWRKKNNLPLPDYSAILKYTYNNKGQLIEKQIRDDIKKISYLPNGEIDKVEEFKEIKAGEIKLLRTHQFKYEVSLLMLVVCKYPEVKLFYNRIDYDYKKSGYNNREIVYDTIQQFNEYVITYNEKNQVVKYIKKKELQTKIYIQMTGETILVNSFDEDSRSFYYDEHGIPMGYRFKVIYSDDE